MFIGIFDNVENKEKEEAIETLVANSSPRQDYFFLVILSISMATLGVLLDSIIVVIGSMLIAPVLYPVIGIGMGIAVFDDDLTFRSAYTLAQSVVVALLFAILIGIFFDQSVLTTQIVQTMKETEYVLMYFVIAVIAGFASSLSVIKPQMSESFSGIAVSVALVPPLAIAGIAAAHLNLALTSSMLVLFSANIAGIVIASGLLFVAMRLHVKKSFAEKKVEQDEEEVEEELNEPQQA